MMPPRRIDLKRLKAWILTLSASVSMVSVAVSVWVAVGHQGLESEAEQRLQRSEQAETEVRVAQHFVQLARLAQAREDAEVSDACASAFIMAGFFNETHMAEQDSLGNNRRLSEVCMFNAPVGLPAQRSAIVALGGLGCRYEFLQGPAREALEQLASERIETDLAEEGLALIDAGACI